MRHSSASEWCVGDKGRTAKGQIVTIGEIVSNRYLKIIEPLEKKVYIPAHGEIEKINELNN